MKVQAKILYSALLCSASLWATPQLVPTDSGLFEELNGLVNRNVIKLDLSTYPLSQAEIKRALNTAEPQTQSDQLVIQRLHAKLQQKRDGFTLEAEGHSKLSPMVSAYDRYRTSAKQSFAEGNIDLYLQANRYYSDTRYRSQKTDLAGSYFAVKLANQIVSLGLQKRSWGGGHSGSLLLGDKARPFPSIGIQREKQPYQKQSALSWLGRWQYQLFVGKPLKIEGVPHSGAGTIIGARATATPFETIELGIGHIQHQAKKPDNRPLGVAENGDYQTSGIDFRFRLMPWVNLPMSVYGQAVREAGDHLDKAEYGYLIGVDGSHNVSHRQTLNWYFEALETAGSDSMLGERPIGYYHQTLPLGYQWGNNLQVFAIGVNSAYRNNDITALVKDHHWHAKAVLARSINPNLPTRRYQGVEVGWAGHIPIDKYISLKLDTSLWWLKQKIAEEEKSDVGVSSKASIEF